MRKILLALISLSLTGAAFAQSAFQINPVIKNSIPKSTGNKILSIDTLDQYYQRASGFYIYGSQDGGYVYGTGAFDNSGTLIPISDATGCHYDAIGNASVNEILLWVAAKEVVGTADSVAVTIYSVNADTSANLSLGSINISINDLDTAGGNFTSVPISATVTSSFMVAMEYAGIDDTFGLVSSNPANGDGAGEKRARQLLTAPFGGIWEAVTDVYSGQLDCDVIMIPIVDVTTGFNHFETKAYTLKPVYPSPARDFITLDYNLKNSGNVNYVIRDSHGKRVLDGKFSNQSAGNSTREINISKMSAGNYYITFNSEDISITQKFTVIK